MKENNSRGNNEKNREEYHPVQADDRLAEESGDPGMPRSAVSGMFARVAGRIGVLGTRLLSKLKGFKPGATIAKVGKDGRSAVHNVSVRTRSAGGKVKSAYRDTRQNISEQKTSKSDPETRTDKGGNRFLSQIGAGGVAIFAFLSRGTAAASSTIKSGFMHIVVRVRSLIRKIRRGNTDKTVRSPSVKTERIVKTDKTKTAAKTAGWSPDRIGKSLLAALSLAGIALVRFVETSFQKVRHRFRENKIKNRNRIRRTDRERVYKLRGYTTMEKVNSKRKIQRRFRLFQRVFITALCIAVLGYLAFRNNPFTDVTELLRIIGIRTESSVEFHQYEFDIIREQSVSDDEGETETPVEVPDQENFLFRIRTEGKMTSLFYIRAFEDFSELKDVLYECTIKISNEDLLTVAKDNKIGTILVLLGREGNNSSYRFTHVNESGILLGISASSISGSVADQKVYVIGLLDDTDFSNYSMDVEVEWNGT